MISWLPIVRRTQAVQCSTQTPIRALPAVVFAIEKGALVRRKSRCPGLLKTLFKGDGSLKKTAERSKCGCILTPQQQRNRRRKMDMEPDDRTGRYVGFGISLGAAIGCAIGVAMGNFAMGIGLGVGVGSAVGAGLARRKP
jgi:hypothetical protein